MKDFTIKERLTKIEVLLENHLYHHQKTFYTLLGALCIAILGLLFK